MNCVIVDAGVLEPLQAAYHARAGREVSLISRGEHAAARHRHQLFCRVLRAVSRAAG